MLESYVNQAIQNIRIIDTAYRVIEGCADWRESQFRYAQDAALKAIGVSFRVSCRVFFKKLYILANDMAHLLPELYSEGMFPPKKIRKEFSYIFRIHISSRKVPSDKRLCSVLVQYVRR